MRTTSRTAQFKKDYKREAKGQHRATLDADLLAAISLLATDQTLPERFGCGYFRTTANAHKLNRLG
jgi:mRNA interferase YafQ